MRIKRSYKLIFAGVVFLSVLGIGSILLGPIRNSALFDNRSKFIGTNFNEFREIIENVAAEAEDDYHDNFEGKHIQIGITSHHLPTAVSLISNFYTYLNHSQGPRDVFVVLGPDHFERGYNSVSTTFLPFVTSFGKLEVEDSIVNELLERGVGIDDEALADHSIEVQATFIKLFFPQARIVPLIFRANTDKQTIADIADVLSRYKSKINVIASVDFSHYQSYKYARALDAESKKMISDFSFDGFTLEYVDSPPTMELVGKLIDSFEISKVNILNIANSYDFTGRADSTTGYINALFSESSSQSNSILMFVGDIMLSRSIEAKMKQEDNWQWPFLKIVDYLKEADLLFGNLEGPISNKGTKFNSTYSFRADPMTVEGLGYAGFDVLSVANNHIGDWGREAMEDTFRILKENGIEYIGGGYNRREAHSPVIKELDSGTKIAFLAYTNLSSRYWEAEENQSGIAWLDGEQMKEDIIRAKEQSDIVVVSMHFGEEYISHSNSVQQSLAKTAIDAGADLVVGHHPHVAQEIERYKKGYIAYSLGNFVFDQFFSEEVKKGLILRVVVKNKQIKEVKPIEIKISGSLQIELFK